MESNQKHFECTRCHRQLEQGDDCLCDCTCGSGWGFNHPPGWGPVRVRDDAVVVAL